MSNLLKNRILDLAFKYRLSHLGSYFSSIDIIDNIYKKMKLDDIFILSCGHAALALYVCNEKYFNINAEEMFLKHGGHPHRDEDNKIYCSTGSLGLGITIAIGRAVANPSRTVHVLLSDGECEEGSVWESLKIINDLEIENISVHVNINGYAAYKDINIKYLTERLKVFYPEIILHYTTVEQFSFLKGLNAHYHIMSEADFLQGKKELNEKGL